MKHTTYILLCWIVIIVMCLGEGVPSVSYATVFGPPQTPKYSNVLFIPGLEASRLYLQKQNCTFQCEEQLWEPNILADVSSLATADDGTSQTSGIYTKDIIKEADVPLNVPFIGENIYKSFSDRMDALVSDGTIHEWKSFAYDWRQSVTEVALLPQQYDGGQTQTLVALLQQLADSSNTGRVAIVAHSNGGLVAKMLLQYLENNQVATNYLFYKIDSIILVASPQWGTPSAIPALLHGYDQQLAGGLLLSQATARELSKNMSGAYGLLPSAEYYNHVSTPVTYFVPNVLDPYMSTDIGLYGTSISNYTSEKNFLEGGDGRTNPGTLDTRKPLTLEDSILNEAERMHHTIDTLVPPQIPYIRFVQVAGWGLDTISGFQYNASSTCSAASDNGCTGRYMLDERPVFTSEGDKVVVAPSAFATQGGENWWVNLSAYNKGLVSLLKDEHKNILEVTPLLDFIVHVIKNDQIPSSTIVTQDEPVHTGNRLRLSVHSPVTLDAYDANGDHTGKMCPDTSDFCYTEEQIPNSSYLEFGEGKYLNLPEDELKTVKLVGTDVGTFTYESDQVAPNGSTSVVSFADIPVTPQTIATLTLNATTSAPQLALDVDGDGVTDFNIKSQTDFDPIMYLQIMEKTVDGLDIAQNKKDTLDKKIEKLITQIQKGKLDKAKNKIQNLSQTLVAKIAKPVPKKPKPGKISKADAQLLLDMLNQLLDNLS